jgi:hypothetical protein
MSGPQVHRVAGRTVSMKNSEAATFLFVAHCQYTAHGFCQFQELNLDIPFQN